MKRKQKKQTSKEKKKDETWRKTKKVGSLIGDEEDIERRKQLATAALNKMEKVWIRGDRVSKKRKIKLYRALVKSILTYNCGTWGVTKATEHKLDTFHRKQLRRILGIRYPTVITNKQLYKKTGERPISETMRTARWRLLGHILRREQDIPANKAMQFYFNDEIQGEKFKGARRTTLPTVLESDLQKITDKSDHNYCKRLTLKTADDLKALTEVAQNRAAWKSLTGRVRKAGEADPSVDDSAKRP